jgi:hypothetical protein
MLTWTSSAAAYQQLPVKLWTFLPAGGQSRHWQVLLGLLQPQQQQQQQLMVGRVILLAGEGAAAVGLEKHLRGLRQLAAAQA